MSSRSQLMLLAVWKRLGKRLTKHDEDIRALQENKIAEIAFAPPSAAFVDLPASPSGIAWYYVTNGRKIGEGASSGTGVMAWYDDGEDTWYSFMDGTELAT